MGWLLSTSLVSGNTAVLERSSADAPICQRNHKMMPSASSLTHMCMYLFPTSWVMTQILSSLRCSSTWCRVSPCRRTCPQRHPLTYLRRPPRPQPPSRPWLLCPRCHRYWEEPTSLAWEPCADATRTNTPCLCRRVGPTTQHCTQHQFTKKPIKCIVSYIYIFTKIFNILHKKCIWPTQNECHYKVTIKINTFGAKDMVVEASCNGDS